MRRLLRFETMSVLVVDDQDANVLLVEQALAREGLHRITCLTDPREVLAGLPEIEPDLVILDLRMPHLSGLEVLRQIMQYAGGSYLPVLVLTADNSRESRNEALASGARDFLAKPMDLDELVLRVANLLETQQLYQSRRVAKEPAVRDSDPALRLQVEDVLHGTGLRMALQPIAEVATRRPVGHEALARFDAVHPRGPAGWFEDAYSVGLGPELEWLAVRLGIEGASPVPEGQFVAVNLSPAALMLTARSDAALLDSLGTQLVLEVTEHVPVEDYTALHRALLPRRDAGARVAVDDLGAGFADFRHLLSMKPDIIKLDISLVGGLHLSVSKRALARALVAFAGDVGAAVIAEGVEEAAELTALAEVGVVWAQGHYLGRPVIPKADAGRRR